MSITYYDGTVVFRNGGYTDTTSTYRKETIGLTPTTIMSMIMPPTFQETYIFDVRAVGYMASGDDVFISYTLMVNNNNGNITLYGGNGGASSTEQPMILVRDGTPMLDSCRVTSSLSGNTVTISVIGIDAQTVTWVGTVRVHRAIH